MWNICCRTWYFLVAVFGVVAVYGVPAFVTFVTFGIIAK